ADAALAKDKTQVNAYIQKGLALFELAQVAKPADSAAAFARARTPFLALNRMEPDHPLPLIYNYRIAQLQGRGDNANAIKGLARAAEVAPFDGGLRMNLAMIQLRSGQRAVARWNLTPVAYNPHGGPMAQKAQEILARLDADPNWDG